MTAICHVFASPVGAIFVTGDGARLTGLRIAPEVRPGRSEGDALLAEAERQIAAYFAGRLTGFDLPLAPASTPRGEEIRAAMRAIPYGETASYGEL
ncbi:MAG: methylated-DNA--[protein]-cysteine S-methyltransferase, partial [Parasphingopyxis sp.]